MKWVVLCLGEKNIVQSTDTRLDGRITLGSGNGREHALSFNMDWNLVHMATGGTALDAELYSWPDYLEEMQFVVECRSA